MTYESDAMKNDGRRRIYHGKSVGNYLQFEMNNSGR
jgi:hypothetical protein